MADDEGKPSGKARLMSKWSRVLKPKEEHEQTTKHVNSFKLDEDVTAFLKPSTDKAMSTRPDYPAPKIDIAIAQRWPDANEVRKATLTPDSAPTGASTPNGYRKPKRRQGLAVGFVKTAPEIIGEGGDEALDPVSEVGRQRAMMPRSVSDRRPSQWSAGPQATTQMATRSSPEQQFRPQPLRRVQTSHNEFSPPVQKKHVSQPSLEDTEPRRPTLNRAPTGFGSQDSVPLYEEDDHHEPPAPRLDTKFAFEESESPGGLGSFSTASMKPRDPNTVATRRKGMDPGEGMVLRRASQMIQPDEQQQTQSVGMGVRPNPEVYDQLSQPDAPGMMSEVEDHAAARPMFLATSSAASEAHELSAVMSPTSAISPTGASPFDDPRYIKRRSRETTPIDQGSKAAQPVRQQRSDYIPSYMRGVQPAAVERPTGRQPVPGGGQEQSTSNPGKNFAIPAERPGYGSAIQQSSNNSATSQPPPVHSQSSHVVQHPSYQRQESPPRSYGQPARSPGGNVQSRNSASRPESAGSDQSSPRPFGISPGVRPSQVQSARGSANTLQVAENMRPTSSSSDGSGRQPSADYFLGANTAPEPQTARKPVSYLRTGDAQRPGSSNSGDTLQRPAITPQPSAEGNPAADAAYADFAARVAHMKGVFRLTAEKEQPSERSSPELWLRVALWWYLRGKAGLEVMLKQRAGSKDSQHRQLLAQPHVDLAKTWWILSDPLEPYDTLADATHQSVSPLSGDPGMVVRQSVAVLRSHIKSLCLSVGRAQLMPPHQSLIQGQETSIWTEYPRFTADATAALGGSTSKSLIVEQSQQSTMQPLEAIPICDTRDTFCYGRFPVEVSINTDEAETDRVVLPCMLSMLRGKRDFLTSFVIASQSELVSIRVGPRQDQRGLTWHEVSWKASTTGMVIHLPRGFDLTVRMQDNDFRSLWNLSEYARKVERSLRPEHGEKLVHEARLAELQYADSSNANAFPPDKLRGATALVFEHISEVDRRKRHQGYRLLLVTDPTHKSLASAQHDVYKQGPLYFEFITDATANGMAAMAIRIREDNRQCRILLVLPSVEARQGLYDVLNGLTLGPDETIAGKMNLAGMNIEPATQLEGFSQFTHQALRSLQWSKLGVTNFVSEHEHNHASNVIASESLRLMARHASGCITDRLNVSKGELLIRLPCVDKPAIQLLRNPQEDISMSIDIRNAGTNVAEGITELMQMVRQQSTIRTMTFACPEDLHAFQASITGCAVRFDGLAATLGIARRRMVVPIYKKWEASNVRIQVVSHSSVVQVLAFMEGFSHADALCFQVKSTDNFEAVKGDGKGKKWAVKMVEAKFTLPHEHEEKEKLDLDEKVRRRFVNLEGLEYAEEHDDITVGFETQEERDNFAKALPAAPTVSRGITLKRRT